MYTYLKISAIVLMVVAMSGCRGDEPKRMPDTLPDITGHVEQVTTARVKDDDVLVTMDVKGLDELEMVYPQARITVTDDTLIEGKDGQRLKAGQIQQNDLVEVWFDGPVLESMPVQATAKAVRVTMAP